MKKRTGRVLCAGNTDGNVGRKRDSGLRSREW